MHLDVNGTRLWFDVAGPKLVPDGAGMRERPTIVLLHGGPGSFDHSYFKPEFDRLTEWAQLIYLDLRGHGRSTYGNPADWSFEICADDVRAFCDLLGISRPVVFGHSLGGFVALVYGCRHLGHAAGIVLQSTHARFDLARIVEGFRRIGGDEVAEIVERVYGGRRESVTAEEWARCWPLFGPWVPGEREKSRMVLNPELNAPGLRLMATFDVLADLSRIQSPALVCVGSLDPITPVAAAREMLEALPEGLGRLEILEGAGHFPWKEVPDRYWPLIGEFAQMAWERSERQPQESRQ